MKVLSKLLLTGVMLALATKLSYADVKVGEAAPGFKLPDTKGGEVTLEQYKGKFVVLEWFNYDCPFVVKHYSSGNMQNLQKEYTAKGVVWLSINSSAEGKEGYYSAEETNAKAAERNAASTALLLDPKGDVGHLYGAQTTPHMFIINPEGVVIYQGAIDDKASADAADIAAAKNYVKAALDEAMAGQPVTDSATKSYGCSVKY